jgi:hypothetical protein
MLQSRQAFSAWTRLHPDLVVPLTAVFPTSYYLFGGYAESILVVCALASLYFARQKRWWLAGIASAGATLARPIGFLIAIPLALEIWRSGNSLRERSRGLPSLFGVGLGMGAWMLYLQLVFHDAILWVHAEEAWQRVFVIPGQTMVWTMQNFLEGKGLVANNIVDLALTSILFAATLVALKKLPIAFSAYALLTLSAPLFSYAQTESFALTPMAAAGRRAVVIFPAFIALASAWRGKWREPFWAVISATFQALLFVAFAEWFWID